MNITIDARMYQESGVGRYIRNLISMLQLIDKKNRYTLLLTSEDYEKLIFPKNFTKILANFKWYSIKEQIELPKILNNLKPDLVHFPHFNVPIFYTGKFVVTIHDLIHQHFQMKRATTLAPIIYKTKQIGYKAVFKNAVSKSQKILVPSNYVKSQLMKECNINDKKIVVTYEAVDVKIQTLINKINSNQITSVMKKFNIQLPYIFYVGNAHPHKNVEGLINAFINLRNRFQFLNLVLSGQDHYFWQRIKQEFQHQDIIYTGKVNDEELVALYKNALIFVLPSFEEGFGIPALEAMACGTAVVSSNAGSLPEVGGNAVIYFNPKDQHDMESNLNKVLKSDSLRQDLILKGKKRVLNFSWEALAKKTLETYLQCA